MTYLKGILVLIFFLLGIQLFYFQNQIRTLRNYKNIRIAVIDGEKVKNISLPFINIREVIEKEHSKAQNDILAKENIIRKENEKLKLGSLTPLERKRGKEILDKKIADLEKQVQETKKQLGEQFSLMVKKLEETFDQTVKSVAQDHQFDIVLNKSIREVTSVLYASACLDITEEVISRLNKLTLGTL